MLAEKAADLIMNNTPLTPAKVNFYRHQKVEQVTQPARVQHAVLE